MKGLNHVHDLTLYELYIYQWKCIYINELKLFGAFPGTEVNKLLSINFGVGYVYY